MWKFIKELFSSIELSFYLKHLFFGSLFCILCVLYLNNSNEQLSTKISILIFYIVSTLLYPYSRFVYNCLVALYYGKDTLFIIKDLHPIARILDLIKNCFITLILLSFSIFIAPIGLIWSYFYKKAEIETQQEEERMEEDAIRKRVLLEEEVRAQIQAKKSSS